MLLVLFVQMLTNVAHKMEVVSMIARIAMDHLNVYVVTDMNLMLMAGLALVR